MSLPKRIEDHGYRNLSDLLALFCILSNIIQRLVHVRTYHIKQFIAGVNPPGFVSTGYLEVAGTPLTYH